MSLGLVLQHRKSEAQSLFLVVSPFCVRRGAGALVCVLARSTPLDGPLVCRCSCAAEKRSLCFIGHMARGA
jgi:hypothetical protein